MTFEEREQQIKLQKARALFNDANVPLRYSVRIDIERSPMPWRDVYEMITRQLQTGCLLALIGNRGTGKTQLGASAIAANCALERSSRYITAMDVFLIIREAQKFQNESELKAIQKFVDPKLLVMDEMQVRGETAFENRMLTAIVDKRYANMRDTILIANLTEKEFRESLGSSIVDRMYETGGVIPCTWESFRRKAKGGE